MRRVDLVAFVSVLGALVGSGCMRIYPDPELPDAEIDWYGGACDDEGVGDVSITMTGVDDPSDVVMQTVACPASMATIKDVSRQRFHVTAQLLATDGSVLKMGEADIDLRNGIDETTYVDLGGYENFRVSWIFADGASCESLAADLVQVQFVNAGGTAFGYGSLCDDGMMLGLASPGTYAAIATAYSGDVAVAVSAPSAPMPIGSGKADFGTLLLTPCSGPCP